MLAPVRHPDLDMVAGLQSLVERIIRSGGPVCTTAAMPASAGAGGGPSVFDKLTDTRLYTGSHRERFDDEGRGVGLYG